MFDQMEAAKSSDCSWAVDENGIWSSACGNTFQFETEGPRENRFRLCPYCGKGIEAAHAAG
jgi:hypothetical protein